MRLNVRAESQLRYGSVHHGLIGGLCSSNEEEGS